MKATVEYVLIATKESVLLADSENEIQEMLNDNIQHYEDDPDYFLDVATTIVVHGKVVKINERY